MPKRQVKICGVRHPEDARSVVRHGADYLGMILSPGFSRSITLEKAADIAQTARAEGPIDLVGVFVNPSPKEVDEACDATGLDVVQLHGEETAGFVSGLRTGLPVPVWKMLRVPPTEDVVAAIRSFGDVADGLGLDTWHPSLKGGTGEAMDWKKIATLSLHEAYDGTFIAAGGLTPENVGDAITLLQPNVVDVSSGVETSPGRKNEDRIRQFIDAVKQCPDQGRGPE